MIHWGERRTDGDHVMVAYSLRGDKGVLDLLVRDDARSVVVTLLRRMDGPSGAGDGRFELVARGHVPRVISEYRQLQLAKEWAECHLLPPLELLSRRTAEYRS